MRLLSVLVLSFFVQGSCIAQDTLHLTLPELEELFTRRNLSLLAQRYNIDIARAQVLQARLYNNPEIQFTGNIYNPQQKKEFDMSQKTGQYVFDIDQVITLAGKRNKQIQLAETGALLQENRFFDLMRTLRFTLRSDFFQLYFLRQSIEAYDTQISFLEELNFVIQGLQQKGIFSMKDALRIKSLLYTLKAEKATLQNQVNGINADIQLIIRDNHAYLIPETNNKTFELDINKYDYQTLLDSAYKNRYDLKFAENSVMYAGQNVLLQKSLAVPDLNIGAEFDKRGSFVKNASFFKVGMPLAIFNRNQGNIKAALFTEKQSDILLQQQNQIIENDVMRAYANLLNTDKMLRSFDPEFKAELQTLLQAITENYKRQNISLLDFTDFYESYKENILQLNQLQNERMQSVEALNFAVGQTVYLNY